MPTSCAAMPFREWLAEREAELLPVPYYHVVFTLPAAIADIPHAKGTARAINGFLQGLSLSAPTLKSLDAVQWPLPCSAHV